MDEIALGQYHDLVQYLIRISNPKLSIEEVNKLIAKGEEVNQSSDKRGFYYTLKVGKDPVNDIDFTIVPKGGW